MRVSGTLLTLRDFAADIDKLNNKTKVNQKLAITRSDHRYNPFSIIQETFRLQRGP